MTHSLHRTGLYDELKDEFVVLGQAADGINVEGAKEKLIKISYIAEELQPVNFGFSKIGCVHAGVTFEQLRLTYTDRSRFRCVFNSYEKIKRLLQSLKDEDLGISITIAGLMKELQRAANEIGLTPHSVNLSLGVFGKKELLSSMDILEITTMCGHHLVSPLLVQKMISDIKKGKMSAKEGSIEIARPCICGFVNQERVEKIIERVINKVK